MDLVIVALLAFGAGQITALLAFAFFMGADRD